MSIFRICLAFCIALGLLAPAPCAEQSASAAKVYQEYAVAADHPAASRAGLEVLNRGGNVVDAAVATSFALSVVRPSSCGIGGGGFMLIWNAESKSAITVDYRERAPLQATADMFAPDKAGASSRRGGLAAAVPGTVVGLCHVQRKYGKLTLPEVLAPAIRLASDGVPVEAHQLQTQRQVLLLLSLKSGDRERFSVLYEKYLNSGQAWKLGERFYSPQLEVLKLIAAQGAEAFYNGPVADALLKCVGEQGGIWSRDDLERMDVVERTPLTGDYHGNLIYTMPPPSSGGVALLETLNILDAYQRAHPEQELAKLGQNGSAYVHLVSEALKHAFADRAEYLGDTDFVKVPVQRLISRRYATQLAERISAAETKPLTAYGRYHAPTDGGTSHFSVIDAHGNAVACTETINTQFGSLVVEPRYGIVLNNEMDDFTAVPGKKNVFGLIQSAANAVAPRKKPLSSMTPTIVVRDGKAVHALGASGGPRIISATLQVLLNLTQFRQDVQQAVNARRFHHQWMPDVLNIERGFEQPLVDDLELRGHRVKTRKSIAAVQAVTRAGAGLSAAADPRKGGRAAGK